MIDARCDHCKKKIENARVEIDKNFFQVIGDNGKVEADFCKDCYDTWCFNLEEIEKEMIAEEKKKVKDFKWIFLNESYPNEWGKNKYKVKTK